MLSCNRKRLNVLFYNFDIFLESDKMKYVKEKKKEIVFLLKLSFNVDIYALR